MKQIILIRNDLGMSKGKMCSMASHASLISFENARREYRDVAYTWFHESQVKITLKVDSEEQLLQIYNLAINHKIPCSLIKDYPSPHHNQKEYVSVAIGPYNDELINEMTNGLKLL